MEQQTPFRDWVRSYAAWRAQGESFPLGQYAPLPRPEIRPDLPPALVFSPHPDDEVITGALPLRLLREQGRPVCNVAVTLGSNRERQLPRWEELQRCCDYLGMEVIRTRERGLEGIKLQTRSSNPEKWADAVQCVADILAERKPGIVFFPHERDWNSTHIGTHYLVADALARMPAEFECLCVESEYWGAMDDPNLMVEVSEDLLADQITALTFHVGEVNRNPYHLSLPAWMADNVRRGGEIVGGQGAAPPDFLFATLYRLRRWRGGRFEPALERGRFVGRDEDLSRLFP